MSEQEIRVPDLGGAEEVEIIEISVSEGDSVEEEDSILTVESDKASVDLPAPAAGKITRLSVKVGDKLKEGDVVGMLETSGGPEAASGSDAEADSSASEAPEEAREARPEQDEGKDEKPAAAARKAGGSRKETIKVPGLDGFENIPVIEINVSVGDRIEVEDPLITVESDKATMEIPSPHAGTVDRILVSEGDKLSEGDDLMEMTIEEGGEETAEDDKAAPEKAPERDNREAPARSEAKADTAPRKEAPQPAADSAELPSPGTRVHAGPAVRKLARELGADLTRIKGSGPRSRILKEDVENYIRQHLKQSQEGGAVTGGGIPGVKLPDFTQFGDVEREAMTRIQQVTADGMQRNWLNIPHVTQFDDADITDLETFRKGQKVAGEKKGVKLTPLPFLLKACATALAELPQFNVSLDMERKEIVRKKYIHIGIAVDTPAGLMVPVIRDVDQKGLWQLAEEAQDLAGKARDRKLKPSEMQGACFSITSLGGIGGTAFTPIVNAPEVAILGVSKAAMKPVWDGKDFEPRLLLPLSLSYDHRAVNGADAARFTSLLSALLGDIRTLLL